MAQPLLAGTSEFQSTLPAWGVTGTLRIQGGVEVVSIHAPRVGSDLIPQATPAGHLSFNPRSPRGERPFAIKQVSSRAQAFQSTLPAWGATRTDGLIFEFKRVSIHAPRVGSAGIIPAGTRGVAGFNPRSPRGERRAATITRVDGRVFQSTLPAWGATRKESASGRPR